MTHSVSGYVLSPRKFSKKSLEIVHDVVARFMRQNGPYDMTPYFGFSSYCALDNLRLPVSHVQPFVDVPDNFERLSDWNIGFEDKRYMVVEVDSGSHVGLHDAEALEIYDVTRDLCTRLGRETGRKLEMVFSDERQMYLPAEFGRVISSAA